jgi:hypothetical protein
MTAPKRAAVIFAMVAITFVVNAAALAAIGGYRLATFAEAPPPGITCQACDSPEVKQALARAAAYGRSQAQGAGREYVLWFALAVLILNAAVPVLVWRVAGGIPGKKASLADVTKESFE